MRIEQGKGKKDRYVPFPATFKEVLALHIDAHRQAGASHLFEEPGTLESVAVLARDWFVDHLARASEAVS